MTDNIVTLRLVANADGVVTGVRLASGEVGKLGPVGQQAGAQASAGLDKVRASAGSVEAQLARAKTQFVAFLGAAQVAMVLRGMVGMSDEISNINGRLKLATRSEAELATAKAAVFAISQRTNTELASTASLYARLAQSAKDYGISQQRQLALTETINKTFAVSGATAEAQKNTITQFTQSLAGGVLRAEEFNSVIENSPRLAQALADGMGISMGKLRAEVNAGQVSVERLLAALESQADVVAREFAQMPITVERAWTNLRNAVTQTIGDLSAELGAGSLLANGIEFVAEHLGMIGNAVALLAAAVVGRLVSATAAYLVQQATQILQARAQAQGELAAARAAEVHAAARVALGRAGMLAGGQLVAAESALATAQARTAAATQAASLALTAKAGAMRVLNGVMAAFGGPVGVAVTALALFVSWLVNSRDEARRTAQEIKAGFDVAAQSLEAFNKTPNSQGIPALSDALEMSDKLSKQLDTLKEKVSDLAEERTRALARGFDTKALDEQLAATGRELEYMQARSDALSGSLQGAADRIADMIQEAAGLTNVSAETRRAIEDKAKELIREKATLELVQPKLVSFIQGVAGAGAAARLAAADFRELQQATKFDWSDIDKSLNQQLQAANLRNIELSQGKAARQRAELAQMLTESGAYTGSDRAQVEARKAQLEAIIKLEAENDRLTEAQRKASAAVRDGAKASDQAKEAQARYAAQAALAAAELRGPLDLAQEQSRQKVAELDAELAKHNITRAAHKALVDAETAALAKQQAEIEKRTSAPGALLDAMSGELLLLQKIGPERELERRRLQAEADMRRALAEAIEAAGGKEQLAAKNGAKSWAEYEAAMLAAADANAVLSMRIEESARQAEDWVAVWIDGVSRVADAFTSFAMSGLRDFKGLAKDLKSIAKQLVGDLIRTFLQQKIVIPIQAQLMQVFSGSSAQGGGFLDVLRSGFDGLLSGFTRIFSRGGPAAQAMQTATEAGWQLAKAAGVAVVPAGQVGGMMLPGGQMLGGGGSLFGGLGGIAGLLGGAAMGWSLGGDTAGKIGGGLAGGALAYSMLMSGGGLAGLAAGSAAGGIFGGLSGMVGAMGPIGWAALGAFALNSITGGKLFGTSYKMESASQQWGISQAGATGSQSVTEVKQQSFFRGRKWRTTTSALDAEAMAAVNELFGTLSKTVAMAAQQLGIDVPDIVGGTFKREFDSKGNLKREFGTIAGRVYYEAQDAFAARLVGENMLAVAKAAGSAAELEQLANAYRTTGEELQSFATLALAVQEDLRNANGIWKQVDGDGVMTRIVDYIEGMARAGESLADAYTRVQQAITQYGDLIGGVRAQIATRGLTQYQKAQLEVELAYRQQVKQANELAKALGLSGARAEDLAAIEQLRALNMADLQAQYAAQQAQNAQWLQDLALSDLSPLTDAQKLTQAMGLLQTSVAEGDIQRAQKLAEQVLGLGRNLYASGEDYNALYAQVTALVGDLSTQSMEDLQGLTNEQLANLADVVSGLPAQIAQELAALLVAPPPPVSGTTEPTPPMPPAPTPVPPPPSSGGGGGGYDDSMDRCVAGHMVLDDGTRAIALRAGDVHSCMDPVEGQSEQPARWVGRPVLRPCVRLVTRGGAALVCSRTTPFTAVDAPADLPEYTTLAPDMLGQDVIVRRRGLRLVEAVVRVEDAGLQWVVPADFGGRSYPAGEDADALIYSHNMQKASVMVGEPSPYGAQMVTLLSDIAASNAEMARREASAELDALNAGNGLSSVY